MRSCTFVLAFGCCNLHTGLVITLHVVFIFTAESMHGYHAFLCGLTTVTVTWFRICLNTPYGANEAHGVQVLQGAQ